MAARKIVEQINLLKCGRRVDCGVGVEAQGSPCSQTVDAVWQVN